MLCSKPAKQPERWASLGSSYVMKHLRLVLILALVAAFVATACGGGGAPKSVPSDAVAVVGNDTISKDRFNEVLADAKRSYQATHKPFPKPGTPPYGTLRSQIIQLLVERSEYEQSAKDAKVSADDAKKYYDDHKHQYEQPAQPASRDGRHILVKSHALALTVYKK